ncbi:MAG: dephospho-CoA kinase [Clostridia bacterium]|nr:dephospho-CoA kinase [Clostridia bacterium]
MLASRPYVIGLTGGMGSGKSEAARYLETLGAARFDADEVSHALTAPGGVALPAIREAFGDGVFHPDGTLDRTALAGIVFASAADRRILESILHPLVQRQMLEMMDRAGEAGVPVVILDVPLLFETGMDALCDETWALYAPREMQISRIVARDGLTREQASARIDSQMPTEERNARATHAVNTDQPVEKTRQILGQLYHQAVRRGK